MDLAEERPTCLPSEYHSPTHAVTPIDLLLLPIAQWVASAWEGVFSLLVPLSHCPPSRSLVVLSRGPLHTLKDEAEGLLYSEFLAANPLHFIHLRGGATGQ